MTHPDVYAGTHTGGHPSPDGFCTDPGCGCNTETATCEDCAFTHAYYVRLCTLHAAAPALLAELRLTAAMLADVSARHIIGDSDKASVYERTRSARAAIEEAQA